MANLKRAQEAARVLEEMLKLEDTRLSARMKEVRFRLYDVERDAVAAGKTQ
jgi:thiamine-phosphate pyrophosphorylase